MTTAQTVFAHIATLVRQATPNGDDDASTQARARVGAMANSLEQVGSIAGDLPITLGDARFGYKRLSAAVAGDDGRVTARRKTCGDIASLLLDSAEQGGSAESLAAVFDAIAARFATSDDPRQIAMRDTARREAAELRS
jgi:hypothetical protein